MGGAWWRMKARGRRSYTTEPVMRLRSTRLADRDLMQLHSPKLMPITWSEIEGRRICPGKAWVPEGPPMFLPFSDAEVRAFALLNGYDRVAATDGIIALRIESQATARIATNSKCGETIERELFYFVDC